MKKRSLHTILLLGLALHTAQAGTLTLDPDGGPIGAPPGGTTGWGFTFAGPDPAKWVSIIGSILLFETNSSLGFYTDLIGTQGGPSSGFLPAGSPPWTQTFDQIAGTGAGFYSVDPFVVPGAQNTGTLRVLYEVYTADPASCGGCFESAGFADAEFTIQVRPPAAVPEPSAFVPLLLACGSAALRRRRI